MRKKILITGGAGFIGFNLVKSLGKNNYITILPHSKVFRPLNLYTLCAGHRKRGTIKLKI